LPRLSSYLSFMEASLVLLDLDCLAPFTPLRDGTRDAVDAVVRGIFSVAEVAFFLVDF
jgi:hypothetical protein